jgi:hypothetical protein
MPPAPELITLHRFDTPRAGTSKIERIVQPKTKRATPEELPA